MERIIYLKNKKMVLNVKKKYLILSDRDESAIDFNIRYFKLLEVDKKMVLTEVEWCMAQLGNVSSKTYEEYLRELEVD